MDTMAKKMMEHGIPSSQFTPESGLYSMQVNYGQKGSTFFRATTTLNRLISVR